MSVIRENASLHCQFRQQTIGMSNAVTIFTTSTILHILYNSCWSSATTTITSFNTLTNKFSKVV